MDRSYSETDIGENKGPPGEVESHLSNTEEDGSSGEGEEPEGDQEEEETGGNPDGFPDVADRNFIAGEAKKVRWEDLDGLGAEDDESA